MVGVNLQLDADLDLLVLRLHLAVVIPELRCAFSQLRTRMVGHRRSARLQEVQPVTASSRQKRREPEPTGQGVGQMEVDEPEQQPEAVPSAREIAAAQAARQRLYGKASLQVRTYAKLYTLVVGV